MSLCSCPGQLQPHRRVEGVCPPQRGDGDWFRGDWMQLHSGGRFYPLDPRPEDINPEDIAHALSLLCRYGGHIDRFYSVAEHCVLMSKAVSRENALHALLHDATEAYVVDVPRPLKRYLPEYQRIEDDVWSAISQRFNVSKRVPTEVHDADVSILINETRVLMPNAERWPLLDDYMPLPATVVMGWSPALAKVRYLNRLKELLNP